MRRLRGTIPSPSARPRDDTVAVVAPMGSEGGALRLVLVQARCRSVRGTHTKKRCRPQVPRGLALDRSQGSLRSRASSHQRAAWRVRCLGRVRRACAATMHLGEAPGCRNGTLGAPPNAAHPKASVVPIPQIENGAYASPLPLFWRNWGVSVKKLAAALDRGGVRAPSPLARRSHRLSLIHI